MKTAGRAVVDAEDVQMLQELYYEAFEMQGQWREEKAAEFPDDERNMQSAAGLHALAEWFFGLPENHPLLHRLAVAAQRCANQGDSAVMEEESRLISRFRFGTGESFEEFIETLIENLTPEADPLEAKRRESRLRRALRREGYVLLKSRARHWRLDDQQGYMILDPSLNISVGYSDYSLDLDDVERWLNGE
jgi:hypothetical protein